MKYKSLSVLLGVAVTLPAHTGEQEQAAGAAVANAVKQGVQQEVMGDDTPDWLRRTDISVDLQNDTKPVWSIESIQPLYQSADDTHTAFWQGRLAHGDGDETLNLGLGYRYLTAEESWLLGGNAWYDVTREHNHMRYGLGLEALGRYADFRFNLYEATSDIKVVHTEINSEITEEALDGWDLRAEFPVPYAPWARVSWTQFDWDRTDAENIAGNSVGLRVNLTGNLEVELGASDDNTRATEGYATLTWYWDRPRGVEHTIGDGVSDRAFKARDLRKHTLDKVRRHHDVVVSRARSGGGGLIVGRRN